MNLICLPEVVWPIVIPKVPFATLLQLINEGEISYQLFHQLQPKNWIYLNSNKSKNTKSTKVAVQITLELQRQQKLEISILQNYHYFLFFTLTLF